jgi:hypothetical protein
METSSEAINQIVATMAANYYTNLIYEVIENGKIKIEEFNYEAGLHFLEITSNSYPGVTVTQTNNTQANVEIINLFVKFTEETVGITKVAEIHIDEDEEVDLHVYVQPLKVQCQLSLYGVDTHNLYSQVEAEEDEYSYQLDEAITTQLIVDGIRHHMKEIDDRLDLL